MKRRRRIVFWTTMETALCDGIDGIALRVHASSRDRDPLPPATVPLLDRERELGELRSALGDALTGTGRVLLLGGEPGIGKTRLASVLAGEADARGVPVWWGRAFEDGTSPAFWPWNAGLRRWIDKVGPAAAVAAAGPRVAEVANVFPVLREHVVIPPGDGRASDGARFQVFEAVSRFLAAIARRTGLVVVLDDVHWCDQPSLRLLEFLATDLADTRLLVVATYRDTEVERTDPFHATLSRLAREESTRRLSLGGLSREHCACWLRLVGVQDDAATLGAALHRETNGNPFFLGELLHLLVGAGEEAAARDGGVPRGVREVVSYRLERLGTACRTTLAAAAVAGDTVDGPMLAQVLGDPDVADQLARAVRDRLLVETGTRAGEYGFAHALIRRVLIEETPPSTRAVWHARIAAVLERRTAVADEATTALVRHLAAAATPEALRKAFDYACRGAEQAARGLGWEEAARLYAIALDVGRRAGLLGDTRAIELRLALARAWRAAGDVPAARACCEEVLAACRRTSHPAAAARAALIYAGLMPEWGRVEPAVRAVLEEACRLGPALGDALRARLEGRLAGDLVAANEVDQAGRVFALCDQAAAAARRAGDPGALAVALTGTYFAAALLGAPAGTHVAEIPSTQEILAAAEAGGEHEYAVAIRYARAATLLAIGESDAFSAEVDGMATAAAAAPIPEAVWLSQTLAALRDTVQGRFEEARLGIDRALATGRRAHLPNAVGVHMSQRIMWHAFQGRLAEIAPEIDAFVSGHPSGPGWRPFRALARLAGGDTVAARAELEDLLAPGLAPGERGMLARCHLAGLAALCVALRAREHAPALYARLARRADAWSVDGCQTVGPWALALGSLARLCDRPADAERHFDAAIRIGRRMGSRPVVARAQSLLAGLRLSMRPDEAGRVAIADLLAEAEQTARALGLADVTARVERLRTRLARGAVAAEPNVFRHDADVWTVQYAGRDVRLKDGKGPRYLATLLAAPGREVHVLHFAAPAAPASSARTHEGLSVGLPEGTLDDAPDERARREYRARIGDLQAQLEEAEGFADRGREERLRAELEEILSQLSGQFGSRARRRGNAERARKAVTKVLRTQIGKLLDAHPALGRHLGDSVRMGTVCVYAPAAPVDWDVCFGPASR